MSIKFVVALPINLKNYNSSKLQNLLVFILYFPLLIFMSPRACSQRHYVVWLSKRQFDFFSQGDCEKVRGGFYNLRPDYFFFKWAGEAGRGDNPGHIKKFRQGEHMGVLTNIYFKGLFFI